MFSVASLSAILFGLGINLVFAFAPNIVAPLAARILTYVGFLFMLGGVVLFVLGVIKFPKRNKIEKSILEILD